MAIEEYKAALKNIIDATEDEETLKRWKKEMESELKQYRQQHSSQVQDSSSTEPSGENNHNKDDESGYVVLESGLGIDE